MFAKKNEIPFSRDMALLLMAAVMAAFFGVSYARTAVAGKSPGADRAIEREAPQLAVGDRVKITFFEILDVPQAEGEAKGTAGSAAPMRSFFQRMDLTGEYTVELDGSISVPRLGAFDAARRPLTDVQSSLANGFEKTMSRPCDVAIAIIERQPVYVMGAARQPGAYKYTSGLMVLHALALAGGMERQAERSSRLVDILREQERQSAIAARLKRLLAQKARLESERDGNAEPAAPERLRELAGLEELRALLQAEMAVLLQHRRAFEEENLQNAAVIEAVRREIDAIDERHSKGQNLVALREQRVREMSDLSKRGSVSNPALTMAKTDLAQVASEVEQTVLLKVQAEQRLQQAERDAARTKRARETRIQSELALTTEEIMRTEAELSSAQRITATMAADNVDLARASGQARVVYEIVRRQGGEEATVIHADEMTLLAPGDVLRVNVESVHAQAMKEGTLPPQAMDLGAAPAGN